MKNWRLMFEISCWSCQTPALLPIDVVLDWWHCLVKAGRNFFVRYLYVVSKLFSLFILFSVGYQFWSLLMTGFLDLKTNLAAAKDTLKASPFLTAIKIIVIWVATYLYFLYILFCLPFYTFFFFKYLLILGWKLLTQPSLVLHKPQFQASSFLLTSFSWPVFKKIIFFLVNKAPKVWAYAAVSFISQKFLKNQTKQGLNRFFYSTPQLLSLAIFHTPYWYLQAWWTCLTRFSHQIQIFLNLQSKSNKLLPYVFIEFAQTSWDLVLNKVAFTHNHTKTIQISMTRKT